MNEFSNFVQCRLWRKQLAGYYIVSSTIAAIAMCCAVHRYSKEWRSIAIMTGNFLIAYLYLVFMETYALSVR